MLKKLKKEWVIVRIPDNGKQEEVTRYYFKESAEVFLQGIAEHTKNTPKKYVPTYKIIHIADWQKDA